MKKLIIIAYIFFISTISYAGIDLPFSTTFDCDPYLDSGGGFNPICDGIESGLDGTDGTEITETANNPLGSGKGIRFLKGDGKNIDSTWAALEFNTPQTEFWIRWYIKYDNGFAWDTLSYDKLIYLYTAGYAANCDVSLWLDNNVVIYSNPDDRNLTLTGGGWTTMMSGATSDGSWHCIEAHFKMDTNSSNGVGQVWVDGTLRVNSTDVDYSGGSSSIRSNGWYTVMFDSNQAYPDNDSTAYTNWDDIEINNTGYIGPIESESSTPNLTGLKSMNGGNIH